MVSRPTVFDASLPRASSFPRRETTASSFGRPLFLLSVFSQRVCSPLRRPRSTRTSRTRSISRTGPTLRGTAPARAFSSSKRRLQREKRLLWRKTCRQSRQSSKSSVVKVVFKVVEVIVVKVVLRKRVRPLSLKRKRGEKNTLTTQRLFRVLILCRV